MGGGPAAAAAPRAGRQAAPRAGGGARPARRFRRRSRRASGGGGSSERASISSGSTSSAGGSDDQVPPSAASSEKAMPPTQSGPAPTGRSSGSSARRLRMIAVVSAIRSAVRDEPRETTSWALPTPAIASPSRSGSSQQNQRSSARREANAAAQGSMASTAAVTVTSRRGPPEARSARRSIESKRLFVAAVTIELSVTRAAEPDAERRIPPLTVPSSPGGRGRSPPRPCAPSRSARAA